MAKLHNYLAIEIGGTKLQMVVADASPKILHRKRFVVDSGLGGEGIRAAIREHFEPIAERFNPQAITIGFGGPVDWKTGQICCSHQIKGWNNFNLAKWFAKFTKLPVLIENDANVAALGEAVYGAGRNFDPVFYVTLGSGVGGGLVQNKKIYHGAKPGESEIGHLRLDRKGTILEARCSGWAVDKRIREHARRHPGSRLAKLTRGFSSGQAKALKPALEKGDEPARKILDEVADDLAFGLGHVVHLIHPQIIILGGGLSLLGEPLRKAVAARLPFYVMEAFSPAPKIMLSKLGEDVVPLGCIALASQR